LTAGVAFVFGTTRLFRGFALVAFFLVFMLASLPGLALTISGSPLEVNHPEVLFCRTSVHCEFLTCNFTCKNFGLAVSSRTKAFPNASQVVGGT
jgi:hypothetical protein